jgi:hypothetical protein
MRIARSAVRLTTGLTASVLLILSCSDDSPGHADAAACQCPAAEPPLAGRIQRVTNTRTVPANGDDGVNAACPDGALIIGGGCATSPETSVHNVVLQFSHQDDTGRVWVCRFHNNEATPVGIRASVYCLIPAP